MIKVRTWKTEALKILNTSIAIFQLSLASPFLSVALWTAAHQASLSMGILQAKTLEWVAVPSSKGSSQPRDQTQVSHIAGGFFTD